MTVRENGQNAITSKYRAVFQCEYASIISMENTYIYIWICLLNLLHLMQVERRIAGGDAQV